MSLIYTHSVSPSSIIFSVTDKDALLVLRAVVSKVGNFAIMICREFKLAHEVPAQEPFFPPKCIQRNSLFFVLLWWKNTATVLSFL